jgi:hypothetical protein
MLYLFGFEETCLALGDVFFVDPEPGPGQEGAEAGVRVEIRQLERLPLRASVYSAQPMAVETPLVRFDLFESFPGGQGTNDRVHYHPTFDGWDPSMRKFDPDLSADPLGWLAKRLADLPGLLGVPAHPDAAALAEKSDEIISDLERLWAKVRSGAVDPAAGWTTSPAFRQGWL